MKQILAFLLSIYALALQGADINVPIEKYKLKNGLTVILSRDTSAPVVSIYMLYGVGARSEEKGRTGFAHLFEHMMFQGSANAPKGTHFKLVESNGGNLNGSTHPDFTDYHEVLPSNKLAVGLWLEADRMRSLAITPENLANQKEAVKQERRLSFDNRPYATAIVDRWPEIAFHNWQSAHSIIGSFEDLNAASVDDVSKFFKTYYAPNNAVLAIAGDIDIAEAKKWIEQYFAAIPAQTQPKHPDMSEPARPAARAEVYRDPLAQVPAVIVGYPGPARRSPDYYALAMLDVLLTGGESSRFQQNLVKGRKSVVNYEANLGWPFTGPSDYKDPGFYAMYFMHHPQLTGKQIVAQVEEEIATIQNKGVEPKELERARTFLRAARLRDLQRSLTRAQLLAQYELFDGKPELINSELDAFTSVTAAQIQAAAKKYIVLDRRIMLEIVPAPKSESSAPAKPAAEESEKKAEAPKPSPAPKPTQQPPQTPAIPAFKLPPLHETKLSNGMRVVLVEDARFPLLTARLAFAAGSKFDPADLPGLSEATAALLTEGTKSRSSRQIAEETATIGGALNASTGADTFTISGSALAEHSPKLLELIADAARNASFPTDEVALYRKNRKQRLLEQRSQAEFLAEEKLNEVVFGKHPYRQPTPTEQSIDRLDPAVLSKFRDTHLVPNNGVLILLGKLPPRGELMKTIEARFGAWPAGKAPALADSPLPAPARSITLVDRPGSVQADIYIGRLGLTRTHPDYFPLVVGNAILGGGTSSRLFNEIREKKGYAYHVSSHHAPYKDAALFETLMQVRNEIAGDALRDLLAEMDRIAAEPVSASELSDVKNYISGNFVMGLERQESLANQLVTLKALNLPENYLETYTARIRSVEPEQIRAAAKQIIAPSSAAIVVVGDAKALRPALEKFGKIEVAKP